MNLKYKNLLLYEVNKSKTGDSSELHDDTTDFTGDDILKISMIGDWIDGNWIDGDCVEGDCMEEDCIGQCFSK